MSIKEWLDAAGINGPNAVAGFGGGFASIFFNQKMKPFDIAGALVGGTLTAIYLGPPISDMTHLPIGAVCFLVGFAGLEIAARLALMLRNRLPTSGGTGGPTNAAS